MGDWRARGRGRVGEDEGEPARGGAGDAVEQLAGNALAADVAAESGGLRRRLSIRAREGHEMLVRVLRELALAGVQPRKALIQPLPGSGEEVFLVEIDNVAHAATAIGAVREIEGVREIGWAK